ncbi:MAG: nuclear transport factor 2 family protein [Woeseiaceae bacterium]|nr:nuclear transport factor 2 family protein [Woeseiaceae bacterium]
MNVKNLRHAAGALLTLTAAMLLVPSAMAADIDDVRAVVNQYLATEGDLERQARLMTDDRSFIAGGFRQTDNVTNMQNQIAAQKRNQELDPDSRLTVTGEDIRIRMLGNRGAVASFYRFWTVLVSADSVREGRNPQGPPNDAVTLVLEKIGNDWKIVHTHQSPVGDN